MARKRVCSKRCHSARGTRCRCVCGGFYHGKDGTGAANRATLGQATEAEQKLLLEQHGFKEGETAYIEQQELPLEVTKLDKGLLSKGTVIHYAGFPLELAEDTVVLGNAANFTIN
jgi:hypothetical protein